MQVEEGALCLKTTSWAPSTMLMRTHNHMLYCDGGAVARVLKWVCWQCAHKHSRIETTVVSITIIVDKGALCLKQHFECRAPCGCASCCWTMAVVRLLNHVDLTAILQCACRRSSANRNVISITIVVDKSALSCASLGVQPKQTAATCSAVLSSSTEMRFIASISVSPFTVPMPPLNDTSLSQRISVCGSSMWLIITMRALKNVLD